MIFFHAEIAESAEPTGYIIVVALRFLKFCEFCVRILFHHDFPRFSTHFHEIQPLRQFHLILPFDFLGQNGLPKGVGDGHSAFAFNDYAAFGRIGINLERTPMVFTKLVVWHRAKYRFRTHR